VRLLEGVRVLDLSRMLAGPYGSMLLADLGAEVIKIEDPRGGDPMRAMGPPFLGPDHESAYFLSINRNKKSIALDLESPEGREVLHDLCRVSDVVWENFRPGVMARLGCAPATLRELNPRLVVCSISAFGHDGPYREWPAFDLALQAMGGAMSLTGEAGRAPARMGLPMGDLAGGMFGALAVASALFRRAQTSEGAHFDLSLLDCQVSLLTYIAQYFWAGFCRAIERPELETDARFDSNPKRVERRSELVPMLEAVFPARTTAEWLARLQREGVPVAPINSVDQVVSDPQVLLREMVVDLDHPTLGKLRTLGTPVKAEGASPFRPVPPRALGEDTDPVLRELLGYSPERIAALRERRVVA